MSKQNDDTTEENTITFHYLKSSGYKVVHVDGAISGRTPQGLIHLSTFSERPSIPRETTHKINSDGTLNKEHEAVTRGGIVREMDVDLMMNLQVAKDIHQLLGKNIQEIENSILAQSPKGTH